MLKLLALGPQADRKLQAQEADLAVPYLVSALQLVATMLYLDSENKKDMNLYINCSGGEVGTSAGASGHGRARRCLSEQRQRGCLI